MRVLVACEFSGIVREAFRRRWHDAWSCDLLPAEDGSPQHFQGDILKALPTMFADVELMIAHPPCTYLSRAGARWWKNEERCIHQLAAAAFVKTLATWPIPKIAIENPIGALNRLWRYPDQTIQPWQFGHPFSKATCLWLKNLPPLISTMIVEKFSPLLPSNVGWNARKGQKHHRGHTRSAKEASRTFKGIAEAMAEQWGHI